MNEIKILICAHKPSVFPRDDIFLPIQVGKAISNINLPIQGDNTGDNISNKNKSFCELTALYWAWKNIKIIYPDIQYIGLFHYRRYLALNNKLIGNDKIIVDRLPALDNYYDRISNYLRNYQIILPRKIVYPYSLALSYMVCHYSEDYRILKEAFQKFYPEYYESFVYIFEKNNKLFPCNIFITHYSQFTRYCEWLFPFLFQFEQMINIDNYNEYQKRIIGFISERLFNIFVYHNKLKSKHKPSFLIDPDRQNKKYSVFSKYKFCFWYYKTEIKKQLAFLFQKWI
jgi:hypothetical protein